MAKPMLTTDNVEQGSTSTTASGGLTIPKELFGRVIASVRETLVWAPLAAISIGPAGIPGSSVDIDLVQEGETTVDVYDLAEGAEIPQNALQIETFNLKPVKYGVRLPITKEMLEDGKFDLMGMSVDTASFKMGKKIDTLIIDTVDTNAGNTITGGATISFANITRAIQYLEDASYKATDFIVGPEVANDIRNIAEFVHADKSGVTNPSEHLIGRIFNMNVWVSDNQTSKYAYVIDRRHAFVTAFKRAVTVQRFEDLLRDGTQSILTMRYVPRYLRANATVKITTT